jgi:hypothetical protein
MTDMLQRSLGPSIVIETHFPLVGKPVMGDANQLEMMLLNLAVNARDAMPGGGLIVIATEEKVLHKGDDSRLKPGIYICLSVRDTGEGMDEATLQRAMEPFFTTKGLGKGTGLGLSMVHGIAEQSGGWFNLRSRKDEGTTAELWLPVAEQHAATGQSERPADPVADRASRNRSILRQAGAGYPEASSRLGRSGHYRLRHATHDRSATCQRDQKRVAGTSRHYRYRLC